jgi:hypothetical protein
MSCCRSSRRSWSYLAGPSTLRSSTGITAPVGYDVTSWTRETVILLHDTLNADVRTEQVDFSTFDSVCFVDLDLVNGRVARGGPTGEQTAGGLAVVVTGDRLDVEWPTPYSTPELYADFSR